MDKQQVLQKFGKRLRACRESEDISQEKLAELSGLHRTYISDIEQGNRNVSLVNINRLSEALNVSASELVSALD